MSVDKGITGIEPSREGPVAGSVHDLKKTEATEEQAAVFLRENESQWAGYEPSEARRVLRKIDWRLMPLIVGTITIAAVDVSQRNAPPSAVKVYTIARRKFSSPTPPSMA